jgi:predicted RNA-binding Zn ribbon-like protein
MNEKPVNTNMPVKASTNELPFVVHLPLTGGRPCLDFINTIDWRLQPEKCKDALIEYSDLLAFSLRLSLITTNTYTQLADKAGRFPQAAERAVSEARAFRDALTNIIDDIAGTPNTPPKQSPRREALALLNEIWRRVHATDSLLWKKERFVVVNRLGSEDFDIPWFPIVLDAEELLCSHFVSRIRICAADGCGWAFLDTSKNGTRRWCSMKLCGNREKARRFKEK